MSDAPMRDGLPRTLAAGLLGLGLLVATVPASAAPLGPMPVPDAADTVAPAQFYGGPYGGGYYGRPRHFGGYGYGRRFYGGPRWGYGHRRFYGPRPFYGPRYGYRPFY